MQGAERVLKGSPCDRLAAARLPHDHRGVSGVFGLVQLNYIGHGEGGHLETVLSKFCLYSFFQLEIKRKIFLSTYNQMCGNCFITLHKLFRSWKKHPFGGGESH